MIYCQHNIAYIALDPKIIKKNICCEYSLEIRRKSQETCRPMSCSPPINVAIQYFRAVRLLSPPSSSYSVSMHVCLKERVWIVRHVLTKKTFVSSCYLPAHYAPSPLVSIFLPFRADLFQNETKSNLAEASPPKKVSIPLQNNIQADDFIHVLPLLAL